MDVDLKTLYLYTEFQELWEIFLQIVNISTISEQGFNLLGFTAFAVTLDELPLPAHLFWEVMLKFLTAMNKEFQRKIAKKRS